jgi:hypothetical protein
MAQDQRDGGAAGGAQGVRTFPPRMTRSQPQLATVYAPGLDLHVGRRQGRVPFRSHRRGGHRFFRAPDAARPDYGKTKTRVGILEFREKSRNQDRPIPRGFSARLISSPYKQSRSAVDSGFPRHLSSTQKSQNQIIPVDGHFRVSARRRKSNGTQILVLRRFPDVPPVHRRPVGERRTYRRYSRIRCTGRHIAGRTLVSGAGLQRPNHLVRLRQWPFGARRRGHGLFSVHPADKHVRHHDGDAD